MHGRHVFAQVSAWILAFLFAASAHAARSSYSSAGELSLMGSYSKTNNGGSSYSTERHYSATLSINLTAVTELEASFSHSQSYVNEDPYQTTTTYNDIFGLSLVQTLTPASWPFQPYVKVGAGQYNRKQEGTTYGVPVPTMVTKNPVGILGAGLRIFMSHYFSLKGEGVTYLNNFHFKGARDNFAIQLGVGWHF